MKKTAISHRLNILGKEEEKIDVDDIMRGSEDGGEVKNILSKELLAAFPLTSRTQRDLAIDYMNPREELAKYIQSEDENPPFDFSSMTFLAPYDGIAKQQVDLVKRGIRSWMEEDTKYDPETVSQSETLGGDPSYQKEREWEAMYRKNVDWMHQVALDQTSSL